MLTESEWIHFDSIREIEKKKFQMVLGMVAFVFVVALRCSFLRSVSNDAPPPLEKKKDIEDFGSNNSTDIEDFGSNNSTITRSKGK